MVDSDGSPLVEGGWYWIKQDQNSDWECTKIDSSDGEFRAWFWGCDYSHDAAGINTMGPRILPPVGMME